MKTLVIVIIWLALACFNVFKIYQSNTKWNVLESVFAILLAPVYTFVAFIVIFVIKKW